MDTSPKLRYSQEEIKEFEALLLTNLEKAKDELQNLKEAIKRSTNGYENSAGGYKALEDGADALEKEYLNQLAARTKKYIIQLENALVRIKNNTYGICVDTGKLIPKDRLRAVPHTQHSIEAKLNRI